MVTINDLTGISFIRYSNPFNRGYEFQVQCEYKGKKQFYSKKITITEFKEFEDIQAELIEGLLQQINRDEQFKEE